MDQESGWALAIICVVMLLLCYLAYWIPPHISKVLPLIGLSYPFVLPIVLVLTILAAGMKSQVTWILFFIVIIGISHFFSYFQFNVVQRLSRKNPNCTL
jgi:hypothetical protein